MSPRIVISVLGPLAEEGVEAPVGGEVGGMAVAKVPPPNQMARVTQLLE